MKGQGHASAKGDAPTKRKRKATRTDVHARLVAALLARATITLTAEPEDLDPADSFGYATEEENAEAVRTVHELAERTEWGWCCAHVRATFEGFAGDDYLGGCSYASAEEFKAPGGYYEDMVREACSRIADQLLAAGKAYRALLGGAS